MTEIGDFACVKAYNSSSQTKMVTAVQLGWGILII